MTSSLPCAETGQKLGIVTCTRKERLVAMFLKAK